MITFKIDELTHCLKEVKTGKILDTEVIRIRNKSFLSKFNERTGWYVNWSKFDKSIEIYALVLKGTEDVQGLVALHPDKSSNAVHLIWAVTAPHNNIWEYGSKLYAGVGGHLFAIAGNKSVEYGFDGYIYAEAMNKDILNYYKNNFNAEEFPFGYPPHPYRFIIDEINMKKIMEVYEYENSTKEI